MGGLSTIIAIIVFMFAFAKSIAVMAFILALAKSFARYNQDELWR